MILLLDDYLNQNNDTECFDFGYITNSHAITEYGEYLLSKAFAVELDINEIAKYSQRPRLLSYDLFGTTDLYYILLYINKESSPQEFKLSNRCLIIDKKEIDTYISMIRKAQSV